MAPVWRVPPDFLNEFNKTTRRAKHLKSLSTPSRKNILIFRRRKSVYIKSHPVPLRGALRNVPMRGGDAVDADGASDEGI
jgi:hypothetical protein